MRKHAELPRRQRLQQHQLLCDQPDHIGVRRCDISADQVAYEEPYSTHRRAHSGPDRRPY